jgi:TonB-dependent SusC/RagA subfamily outer membrane receptor
VTASPLNDLNPSDIDRIEVLKGSAASTLYGTEAAAGVIQIFTKRGSVGAPRWTMQIDQGFNKLLPFAPDVDVRPPEDITSDSPRGSYSYELMNLEPYVRTAHRQKYSLSVAGGASTLQYFISGQWDENQGVLPLDTEEKAAVRGNFTFTPLSQLNVQVTSAYNRNDIQNTPAGNNAQGLILNSFRRERNYFSSGHPDTIRLVLDQDVTTRVDRFMIGSTVTYNPVSTFDTRLTVGYDNAHQDNRQLRPYGYRQLPTGKLYTSAGDYSTLTADLVSSYRLDLGSDRRLTLSAGGQSITEDTRIVQAEGTDFAGPGEPDIDAAANRLSWEQRVRVVNAGFFGQALLSLKDRYFLTVGARVDGNSAFGEDFGLQTYPKASASYVISDEDFWSDAMGTLKLRTAYGQSGRAPGTFDAVRTWVAQGYGGQPAYLPSNLGNPNLGPERTGELEFGFDWSGFDDRLAADFTWYHQKTTDALFEVRHAPSEGFALQQQENVGEIENKGIELNLQAGIVDRQSWGLDLGASIYTNKTEVLSLGGSPPFAGNTGWIEEGEPVTLIRGVRIRNGDALVDPIVCDEGTPASATCVEVDVPIGPQQPTHVLGFSAALRLPMGIELSARGEYQGGHYIYDGPSNEGVNRDIRWPTCADYYELTDAGRGAEATAERRYWCDQRFYRRGTMIYPADFFKLRDVTLRVGLGDLIPGSANSTFTVSAQNWYRWRNEDFPIFDPEMVTNTGFNNQNPQITEHIPPTASMVASLRVVF